MVPFSSNPWSNISLNFPSPPRLKHCVDQILVSPTKQPPQSNTLGTANKHSITILLTTPVYDLQLSSGAGLIPMSGINKHSPLLTLIYHRNYGEAFAPIYSWKCNIPLIYANLPASGPYNLLGSLVWKWQQKSTPFLEQSYRLQLENSLWDIHTREVSISTTSMT